jgi:hypothetical protein
LGRELNAKCPEVWSFILKFFEGDIGGRKKEGNERVEGKLERQCLQR